MFQRYRRVESLAVISTDETEDDPNGEGLSRLSRPLYV
jgi:hypothetical protein